MTVQLSPHKISKILRGYFHGLPQVKIAEEAGVDQSSISHYATRFKETAATYGILAAGKEHQMLNEVESLRSLTVELFKSKLTTDEARQGHNIIKAFLKLGIGPEEHLNLVEVCQKVGDPGFVEAALKLSQIETQNAVEYHQVIASFEKALNQLPHLEKKMGETKVELISTDATLAQKKQELVDQEKHLEKYQGEVKVKKAQLENELLAEMKYLEIEKKEGEEAAALKTELSKKGLKLETVLKLAKEF